MSESLDDLLALIDTNSHAAQSRVTRLVLALMTADPLMSADVFMEVNADKRGPGLALQELVVSLATSLSIAWDAQFTRETTIDYLRGFLATLETEGVPHD